MNDRSSNLAIALATAMLLAACGGSGDDDTLSRSCASTVSGGGTMVEENCVSCTTRDANLAIDADDATFATIESEPGLTAALVATAQPGVVFPAGSRAGFFGRFPGAPFGAYEVRTFLDGELRESSGASFLEDPDERQLYVFETTRAYDSVQVEVGGGSEAYRAEINSFCAL